MSATERQAEGVSPEVRVDKRNSMSPMNSLHSNDIRSQMRAGVGAMETCFSSAASGRQASTQSTSTGNYYHHQRELQPDDLSMQGAEAYTGPRQAKTVRFTAENTIVARGVINQCEDANQLQYTPYCIISTPPRTCSYFHYYVDKYFQKICIMPDGTYVFCRNPHHFGIRLNARQRQQMTQIEI